MTRIDRTHMFLEIAAIAAERGTCLRRKIGAVIARDGRPLTLGYNGSPAGQPHCIDEGCIIGPDGGCIRTQHAEANAIAFSAKRGIALDGSTIYTTVSPCLSCAKIIINAGIIRVFFTEKYRDEAPLEYLQSAGIPWFHLPPDPQ